ncbi:MAG: helix-turn-helix domain-containing protein, partial [Candidatus Thermoplasmatota archaeon]|nr:helix-turn-helix domain-containing protein [Candidatus Thermoplasmatota archaeon]
GMPMLIGLHSGAGPLEDEVMYSRFDVPLVTPNTFHDYIVEEIPPLVFAAPGGYYVHLNGEMLHRIREERSISLGDVANAAGVSRRTIQLYEEGERGALVEVAVRIEEYLDYPLIQPVNPLRSSYELDITGHVDAIRGIEKMFQEAFAHLVEAGCHVVPTQKSPFETVVEERMDILLTGVGKYDRTLIKKAHVIGDVSGVVERESLIVVDRRTRKDNIDGTPIIDISEILRKGNLEELLELIRERAKQ